MESESSVEIRDLPIADIQLSRFNTRKDLSAGNEDSSISDLAKSIQSRGLLNPVTVRSAGAGLWELVAGQRRLAACKQLGWAHIPAIVRRDVKDDEATSLSLIENVHRADMHPLDKANAFLLLAESVGSVTAVAKETGFSEATIRKYLDLGRLPKQLQQELSTSHGPIGVDALSTLVRRFPDESDQLAAFAEVRGFTRDVQQEILRRSEGDLGRVVELAEEAREGLFSLRTCRDGFCFSMDEHTKNAVRSSIVDGHLSVPSLVKRLAMGTLTSPNT